MGETIVDLTKSEQAVMKCLIVYSGETLYESEIAKNAGISSGSTNQSLKGLLKKKMVLLEKKGNMNFYTLNLDNALVRQIKITQTIAELSGLVDRLKPLAKRIILFGSCAEGINTQDSDIDLAIISQEGQKVQKILMKKKSYGKLQALIFSPNDFFALEKNDKPLYERIQKGIVL